MEPFARGLLAEAKEQEKTCGRKKIRDLIVVTLVSYRICSS